MIAVLLQLRSYKRFFKTKQVFFFNNNYSLAYWAINQIYLYYLVVHKIFVDFYSTSIQLKFTIGTVNLVSEMTMWYTQLCVHTNLQLVCVYTSIHCIHIQSCTRRPAESKFRTVCTLWAVLNLVVTKFCIFWCLTGGWLRGHVYCLLEKNSKRVVGLIYSLQIWCSKTYFYYYNGDRFGHEDHKSARRPICVSL